MTTGIKRAIYRTAQLPGVGAILRRRKKGPIALFYHGVEEEIVDSRVQTLHLQLNRFEEQVSYLRACFEVISLEYFYDCISNGYKTDPSQVIITFDDGYKNNLDTVAPILEAYDLPFTVFVSTKHIGEGIRFPTYYLRAAIHYSRKKQARILNEKFNIGTEAQKRFAINAISTKLKCSCQKISNQIVENLIELLPPDQWSELNHRFSSDQPMNWSEVKQLSDRGVIIGSHCHDHFILHNEQSMAQIDDQLVTSKALIQKHVGECKYIAYPNGGINDITSDAVTRVKESRYSAGFTTIAGEIEAGTCPYILPRIGVETTDIRQFMFTINTCFRYNRNYRDFARDLARI